MPSRDSGPILTKQAAIFTGSQLLMTHPIRGKFMVVAMTTNFRALFQSHIFIIRKSVYFKLLKNIIKIMPSLCREW